MLGSIRNIACVVFTLAFILTAEARAQTVYAPPASPRVTFDFNADWKFIRQDVTGAEAVGFDDSKWDNVSTPHSYNETDSFRTIISHGGGDRGTYKGIGWYRKHFKIPASFAGQKVFIEFEGMRQAGDIYLNGKDIYFREEYHHGMQMDQHVGRGQLRAGRNEILIKVCQNEQEDSWAQQWSFQLRICDGLGGVVPVTVLNEGGK